nr:hypothetical protein [uncultured Flavobacterium sp.]
MKRIFRFIILVLSFNASAQEMSNNMVVAEEDNRNGNGYYTSYSAALQNLNDVKKLDIQKEDSDLFLNSQTYFPNLNDLVINFSKKVYKSRDFENFNNLETIVISYSWNLTKLPDNFTSPKSLKKVFIYNCGLFDLNENFFSNLNIKSVGICGNHISKLPPIPLNNTIQYLNIGYNPISKLPADFENLKELKTLSLKGTDFETFPNEILKLTKIENLELSKTRISNIPIDLIKLKNLRNLYLVGLNIRQIPSSLRESKVANVWISDENLSKKEKNNIIKSLPKKCTIYWTSSYNQMLDINEKCYCER